MRLTTIESTRNERVVAAGRLLRAKARRKTGKMLLEGPNVIEAALDAGATIESIFALTEDALLERAVASGAGAALVSDAVMEKLAATEQPRGPVAVAVTPRNPAIAPVDSVILCGISDPGNAGTLIRSAAAFGFQVVGTPDTVDLWSPKVLRAAAGAHFATGLLVATAVGAVAGAGVHLVALMPREDHTADPSDDLRPIGLMVGNEAHGLSSDLVGWAEATLTVPTSGTVESLNAAVAGSIAMFAIAQGRP